MAEDRTHVERLIDALREVTQKAEQLAAEVTQSLRADRQVGRFARTDAPTAAAPRRRKRERRKAHDQE